MNYKNNFVVAVRDGNGKILREKDGAVFLPFGDEYSILLKNLDSRKAVVDISIDGEDILDKNRLIVDPNSDVELDGFMRGKSATNSFKFIEKTEEIINHRGDRIDDGIIRVNVTFEKHVEYKKVVWYEPYWYWNDWHYHWYPPYIITSGSITTANCNTTTNTSLCCADSDEGITVKGSEINQDFVDGYTKLLEEESTVIILRLKGVTNTNKKVEVPLTVSEKIECPTCGRMSKSSSNYCSNCGTFLL